MLLTICIELRLTNQLCKFGNFLSSRLGSASLATKKTYDRSCMHYSSTVFPPTIHLHRQAITTTMPRPPAFITLHSVQPQSSSSSALHQKSSPPVEKNAQITNDHHEEASAQPNDSHINECTQLFQTKHIALKLDRHNSVGVIEPGDELLKKYQLPPSPAFDKIFTPELKVVAELFAKHNFVLRIAGGAARDIIMDIEPHDIDFATNATPEQMHEMFDKESIRTINLGAAEKHGTVTVHINAENFEITTLRIETDHDGRRAQVRWTSKWHEDANRRDLTINAMFLDLNGILYDYHGGYADLQARRIRFVQDPQIRINEDFLRIMRYFRFFGRIADNPNAFDDAALTAIRDKAPGLRGISGERIWAEWQKILTGNHVPSIMYKMHELGVTKYMGLSDADTDTDTDNASGINLIELSKVWLRSLKLKPQAMTIASALLRTIADIDALNKRLKISNDQRFLAYFIVTYRAEYAEMLARKEDDSSSVVNYLQRLVVNSAGGGSFVTDSPKRHIYAQELAKYMGDEASLKALNAWTPPRFPVRFEKLTESGKLSQNLAFLGRVLEALRQRWIESDFKLTESELTDEQFLDKVVEHVKATPLPSSSRGTRGGGTEEHKKFAKAVYRSAAKRRKNSETEQTSTVA